MKVFTKVVAVSAVSFACADSITGTRDRLQLKVIVDQPVITEAESTTVSISIQNLGPAVTVSTGGCVVLSSIASQATNELVYPTSPWVCPAVLRNLRIPPGSTRLQQIVIYGAELIRPGRATLARGDYVVSALLQSSEPSLRSATAAIKVQ